MTADLEPVGGGDDEELDEQTFADDPEEQQAPAVEAEAEEEEMPDDLLTPAELETRARERAERQPQRQPETEDRAVPLSQLREIFSGMFQPATQQQREEPVASQRPELKPFTISDEQAAELSEKILSQPGGLAKAIAWAVNQGEQRAMQRMAVSNEGQAAMQSAGESFVDRYAARKMRDPETKFGKLTEPVFQKMIEGYNLAELASMPASARTEWLDAMWERAAGRALTQKAVTKPAPSPGVARGAGGRPGSPTKSRVVTRLSESDKQQVYKSLPNTEEGRRRAARQIWEIEHGVTSDQGVRRAVGESMRFAEAVGFGG